MQPLPRAAFARRLRRLPRGAFVSFVADLLGARGWAVAVDGRALVATRDGTERVVYVLPSARSTVGLLRVDDPGRVDTVVARSRTAARAADLARTVRGLDYAVYGADDLHERLWYAIDADARADLLDRYLDLDLDAMTATWAGAAGGDGPRTEWDGSRVGQGVAVGLVVLLVLVAAAIGGALVASDGPGAAAPGAATTTAVAALDPIATPTPAVPAATGCPRPPSSVPAGALRPRLDGAGSRFTSHRWRVTLAQNITRFDRLDERSGIVPEDRYTAIYLDPVDNRFRLEIDHWRTAELARDDVDFEANRSDLWLLWGRYTVSVRGYDGDWTPLPTSTVTPPGQRLLADMRVPGGGRLGLRCVSELVRIETTGRTNAIAAPRAIEG